MPKSSLFRRFGSDNLKNGIWLGAVTGVLIYFGEIVVNTLNQLPNEWMILGKHSVLFYLALIGAIFGYYIDRN